MIIFLPTPIGNPKDITLRTLGLMQESLLFFCEDTRETKKLLRLFETRYDFIYPQNAQFFSFNEHNGKERLVEWGERLKEIDAVYVSDAGMPVISDPGQLLVEFCQKNNIEYDVFPGASAVVTAYAASGFEDGKFLFFGFLPHKGNERSTKLGEALNTGYNTILYESPHRLLKLLNEIVAIEPTRELFAAKELSKKFQTYYRATAQELLTKIEEQNSKGEWVVIIKASLSTRKALYIEDIESLDIPPKPKAKLLAKLTDESVKECYERLIAKK